MNPLEIPELRKQMIDELNIAHLTQEEQNTIITQLSEVLMQRAILDVVNTLSEEDMQQAEALTQSGDNTQLFDFLESKIPNAKDIVMKAFRDGLEEYKAKVNEIAERDGLVQESAGKQGVDTLGAQVAGVSGSLGAGVAGDFSQVSEVPSVNVANTTAETSQDINPLLDGATDAQNTLQNNLADVSPLSDGVEQNKEQSLADILQSDTAPVYTAENAELPDLTAGAQTASASQSAPESILETLRDEVAQHNSASTDPTLIASDAVQAQTPLEQHFTVGEDGEAKELSSGATQQTAL